MGVVEHSHGHASIKPRTLNPKPQWVWTSGRAPTWTCFVEAAMWQRGERSQGRCRASWALEEGKGILYHVSCSPESGM
jgi:hypothetical protein